MTSQQINDNTDKQDNQVSKLRQEVCKITPAILSFF